MSEKVFNKVLAANRGEIAVRIFRACYDLGIHTVAMYSKEDELSLFRTRADEAYLVGENKSPLGAYLDIPEIIDLAKRRGVDAIHPGYGFLSENADFARACEEAGITFIGPPSDVLGKMGDKLSAKQIAMECGVPVIPGCSEPLRDGQEALEKAISFGFPVILKAAAGGGGRGMRLCEMPEDVIPAFELVKNEARKAFGNDDIFIEKYLVQPKHIEVQILADQYGNVRHLGERDCSLQRRYQKVVEFAPAWSVPESIREQLHADAVKIAEAVGYVNAGTVEFLVDRDGNHYFIEMNPRIQVEHTVTEMVTSIDLVRAQILIAEGQPISHPEIGLGDQNNLKVNGYAIQCRVTTEDPANNFAPDNGKIEAYRSGGGFGVRLDGGNAGTGSIISPYYDSLLVKVTSWDCTFPAVCRKATRAINEEHRNPRYLSDYRLPSAIRATADYACACEGAEAVVIVTPSAALRSVAADLRELIAPGTPIVICSKGVEEKTGLLPIDTFAAELGNAGRMAVLSGPTHAEEVICRKPSAAVVASADEGTALFFRDLFATRFFRTYTSDDPVGVELCAAFKNVIAIAVGISYGMGFGDNTAAMLITRGLAEMSRMVVAAGGEALTCMGLGGAGDMVVTCMSQHSRNRRFGEQYVARGLTLDDFTAQTHMVVEGAIACKTLATLEARYGVDLPLTDTVRSVVWEGVNPREAAAALIDRPLKSEFY